MAKAFVCYAQRSGAGYRRSVYRTEVSTDPITTSDPKATITSIANFKTYLAGVLNANTLVPVTTLATASLNAINAAIDTLTNGVIAGEKNNIKVSIEPSGNDHVVRVAVVKNGVKTVTTHALVSQPAPAPAPAPSPSPSPSPSGG